MTLWAIADIHASALDSATGQPRKPMDVFGPQWTDHVDRLKLAWIESVQAADTVIVAGDIDWALHLSDAMETLEMLDTLPGRKVLLRGNHDYWWSSKTTNRVRTVLPASIVALHNNAFEADGFNICGTKGSPVPGAIDWSPQHEKLLRRELQRLQLSLDHRLSDRPTIVALHFPPFYGRDGASPFRDVIEDADVVCVLYGHLHGQAQVYGPQGRVGSAQYRLVAGDATGFRPIEIGRDGVLATLEAPEGALSVSYEDELSMTEKPFPLDDLKDLAEQTVAEKRNEMGNEAEARELLDVPSQDAGTLAREQNDEAS